MRFAIITICVLGIVLGAGIALLPRNTLFSIKDSDGATDKKFSLSLIVLDETGKPLDSVRISASVDQFNPNWDPTEGSGDRGFDKLVSVITDSEGRANIVEVGHAIYFGNIDKDGYRRLYDERGSQEPPYISASQRMGLIFRSHGQESFYRPDASRPVVIVMVRNGSPVCTTAPSIGGFSRTGHKHKRFVLNEPVWPKKPSIPGLTYQPVK